MKPGRLRRPGFCFDGDVVVDHRDRGLRGSGVPFDAVVEAA
jgi:hypothetical protein